jgi:hypothetical protein
MHQLGRDGCRKRKAHGRQAVRHQQASRLVGRPALADQQLVRADVGRNDGVARHRLAHDVDDVGRVQPAVHPALIVSGAELFAVGRDLALRPAGERPACVGHRREDARNRADDLDLGGIDLVGIGRRIDVNRRCLHGPWLDQLDRVEADGEDQVGFLQEVPDELVAGHVEDAGEEGVVLGEHPLRHRRHHHRTADRLGEAG